MKKNPVLTAVVAICVIVFVAGAVLAFLASGSASKAKDAYERALGRQQSLVATTPAPTAENVEAANRNLIQLESELMKIRDELRRGAQLSEQSNWTIVNTDIQGFIADVKQYAKDAGVTLAADRDVFGFANYLVASPPPAAEFVPIIDKQRQILQFILRSLIDSKPEVDPNIGQYGPEVEAEERERKALSILKSEREIIEREPGSPGSATGFVIDPAISARVDGAIDTLAFRVTFRSNTTALRNFLNKLAEFQMPIVVRSIEVQRPSGPPVASAASSRPTSGEDALAALFGTAVDGAADEEPEPVARDISVIDEVSSVFTVTLEFLEILLPEPAEAQASPESDE